MKLYNFLNVCTNILYSLLSRIIAEESEEVRLFYCLTVHVVLLMFSNNRLEQGLSNF